MAMRLLPKSEILKAKAADKKRDIDEGLKLATKIDNLREVHAAEEASLETFRQETVAHIHEETKEAQKELDAVKSELKTAKEDLAEARKPLDSEWLTIGDFKGRLEQYRESLDERENLIERREQAVEIESKKAVATNVRAETRENLATARLQDADTLAVKAEVALKVVYKAKDEAVELREKAKREFTHRDLMASARERDVSIKEKAQADERERLAAEWRLLEDRKAMFERNLKRNK